MQTSWRTFDVCILHGVSRSWKRSIPYLIVMWADLVKYFWKMELYLWSTFAVVFLTSLITCDTNFGSQVPGDFLWDYIRLLCNDSKDRWRRIWRPWSSPPRGAFRFHNALSGTEIISPLLSSLYTSSYTAFHNALSSLHVSIIIWYDGVLAGYDFGFHCLEPLLSNCISSSLCIMCMMKDGYRVNMQSTPMAQYLYSNLQFIKMLWLYLSSHLMISLSRELHIKIQLNLSNIVFMIYDNCISSSCMQLEYN